MSPMRLIILLVAAGAAIAAVFLVRSIQAPDSASAGEVIAMAPVDPEKYVLVARRDVPVGRFVTVEDLQWQGWPKDAETPNFIDRDMQPEALEGFVGAVAVDDMSQGEAITPGKLVHPGTQGFMAAMLTPGMRAVTIETSPEYAGSGFILPQDRVDVLISLDAGGSGMDPKVGGSNTETILSNIRVLAIDGIYAPPAQGQAAILIGTRVTLELSTEDSGLLYAADRAGQIQLTLRSIADLEARAGATAVGRAMRDGSARDRVRVYRYGTEVVTTVPAG